MTKSNTLSLLSVSGNLEVADVLSVVTSRAENTYKTKLAAARKVVKEREGVVSDTRAEIGKLAKNEATGAEADKVEALRKAVAAFGGKGKVTVSTTHSNGWNCHSDELRTDDDGFLTASVSVGRGYGNDFQVKTKPSKTLLAKIESLTAAKADLAEAQAEALEWRKKLSSIGSLERQYRAKLAEAKLSETEDGQAVLELLQRDLDEDVLALPVV